MQIPMACAVVIKHDLSPYFHMVNSLPPECVGENVWRSREQQIALGGEILAQTRAAKLLRPGAREADIATVAAGMRKLRSEGYLAA